MKRTLAIAAAALLLASTGAFARHCPKDMKAIDEALAKNPKLSQAQMEELKAQRARGEELHKAGKHPESEAELGKAMKTLGIKTQG